MQYQVTHIIGSRAQRDEDGTKERDDPGYVEHFA